MRAALPRRYFADRIAGTMKFSSSPLCPRLAHLTGACRDAGFSPTARNFEFITDK
jgi:hypothetical protein